jgi:acetyl esterase/lipase
VKVPRIIRGIPPRHTNRVLIYLHPGSYVFGAGVAGIAGAVTPPPRGRSTCSPSTRMAPDHPYPAALDDTVASIAK